MASTVPGEGLPAYFLDSRCAHRWLFSYVMSGQWLIPDASVPLALLVLLSGRCPYAALSGAAAGTVVGEPKGYAGLPPKDTVLAQMEVAGVHIAR